jgi:hypothetical protein
LTCQLQTEKQFSFGIVDSCHVYDSEGFSKIGILTKKSQIILLEASSLDTIQIIFTYTNLMTHIVFHSEIQQFIVATDDNMLISIPKNINQQTKSSFYVLLSHNLSVNLISLNLLVVEE